MARESLLGGAIAPFGRLFDLEGRTRRADYWPYMLLLAAIYLVGFLLTIFAMSAGLGFSIGPAYGVTGLLALLALAATVRRLHDVGWDGLWAVAYVAMMLAFIAFYFYWRYGTPASHLGAPPSLLPYMQPMLIFGLTMNALGLLILVLTVLEGARGPNRYGPDPKAGSAP